jgi:RNA polymerase sigma factor (sigma-70 family)
MEVVTKKTGLSEQAQDDYRWVCRAVRGDQQAYAVLLNRYRKVIHQMAFRMVHNREDAEDLTLEAFGKAFRKLASYSPNYAFSTWLFRIAVNNCIDHIRKKRLTFFSIDDHGDAEGNGSAFNECLPCHSRNPEEMIIRRQQLQLTRHIIAQLNDKYRLMIELRYFEELSYGEIATVLDIPLGTVKAQLFRAKEMLFELLQKPGASAYFETTRKHQRAG